MKYFWEPADIVVGIWYESVNGLEKWVIGYRIYEDELKDKTFVPIRLKDAKVGSELSKVDFAKMLNAQNFVPS